MVHWSFWLCGFIVSWNLEKFPAIISSKIVSILPSPLLLNSRYTYIGPLDIFPQIYDSVSFFPPLFPLSFSLLIVSIAMSLCSLIRYLICYFKKLFIYLAMPDLTCSTQDLQLGLFPWPRTPVLGDRVLVTGPPGTPLIYD